MTNSELSFHDLLEAILRQRAKAFTAFSVVMLAAILITLFAPRTYVSEAHLFVRLGRENVVLDPTATLGESKTVSVSQSREHELNTVATILKSRQLAEKVVSAVGYAAILEDRADEQVAAASVVNVSGLPESLSPSLEITDRDKAIRHLSKNLRVEPVSQTNLVRILYKSHDAELSRNVVSRLIDTYLEEHARLHRSPGAHQFLADQTEKMQQDLQTAEDSANSF